MKGNRGPNIRFARKKLGDADGCDAGHVSSKYEGGPRREVRENVWPSVRIGDSLVLTNGRAFKPSEWAKTGTPIVRIQNLNNPDAPFNYCESDLPAKFLLEDGDLLFAWSGTPGTSFGAHIWRGGRAWLNQHIFKVQFSDVQFDKKFLQLAINQNLAHYIRAAHGGAGLAHITKGRFEDSELPQPEVDIQRRIVAEIEKQFTRLDAGVAALRRVLANLKRYRASILKAACEGQLVPTEAELANARDSKSEFETGEELLARVLRERRDNWKGSGKYKEPAARDSESLPPLPEGWARATLSQLADTSSGGTPKRGVASFYGGTIPWIKSGELNDGHVRIAEEFITKEGLDNSSAKVFPKGTLCIALYGATVGKLGILDIDAATNQAICGMFLSRGLTVNYLFYFLRSKRHELIERGKGGAQPNISQEIVRSVVASLPPLAEQTRIVAEVERRFSVVEELEAVVSANLQRATRLRQSILQKAFTGELV